MVPAAGANPVAASKEATLEAEAIALVSGYVIVTVAREPSSPQMAQALVEVVIGMVGTGVCVHPQCSVVMVVVMVTRPCSHTSQTSIHTATINPLDRKSKHKAWHLLDMTMGILCVLLLGAGEPERLIGGVVDDVPGSKN